MTSEAGGESAERYVVIAGKGVTFWRIKVEVLSIEKSTNTAITGGSVDGFTYKGTGITWGSSIKTSITTVFDIWVRLPDQAETKVKLINYEPNFRPGHMIDLIFVRDHGPKETYLAAINSPTTKSLELIPNTLMDYFAFTRFYWFALKWIPLGVISPFLLLGLYMLVTGQRLNDLPVAIALIYMFALVAVGLVMRASFSSGLGIAGWLQSRNKAIATYREEIRDLCAERG